MNTIAGEVRWSRPEGSTGRCSATAQPASAGRRNSARGRQPKQRISAGVSGAEQANLTLSPALQGAQQQASAAWSTVRGEMLSPLPLSPLTKHIWHECWLN